MIISHETLNGKYACMCNTSTNEKIHFFFNSNNTINILSTSSFLNVKFWKINSNGITLIDSNNTIIVHLNYCDQESEFYNHERIYFKGSIAPNTNLVIYTVSASFELNENLSYWLNYSDIKSNILTVGKHTIGKLDLIDKLYGNKIEIGDYSSIQQNVKFIMANHKTNSVSTFPFPTLSYEISDNSLLFEDYVTNGNIKIGNDVFIANNSQIMSGIKIGDGAIILENSIVTKNIPPYAIVSGNPATIIDFRFSESQIDHLLKIQWWNWSSTKILTCLEELESQSIDSFIQKHSCI